MLKNLNKKNRDNQHPFLSKKKDKITKILPFMIKYLCSGDILYMFYFTTKSTFLTPSFEFDVKEKEKIDRFLFFFRPLLCSKSDL